MSDERDRDRRRPMPGPQSSGAMQGPGSAQGGHGQPDDGHIDLNQVHFDDAFLDSLSRDQPTQTRDDAEYELAALLSGWRHEAITTPAPPLPGIDEVDRAIAAQRPTKRGATVVRTLRVVAGAAAIAVVAAAGLTVVSEGAAPGDALWGVKQVVFASAASETQASFDVRADLEQAEAAFAAGDTESAHELIARAQTRLAPVRDDATRDQMTEWIDRLKTEEPGSATASLTASPEASGTTRPGGTTSEPGTTTGGSSTSVDVRARTTTPQTTTPPVETTPAPPSQTPSPTSATVTQVPSAPEEITTTTTTPS
ncbi:anti-sigma-D factor RsdA [Gordonia desulfuricans]|nr:anti-sigma-D factor RsdA [Gordonia desulfuricans]